MSEDRELLEAAAKAVGYEWSATIAEKRAGLGLISLWITTPGSVNTAWNPLNNDGDALQLAVKLRIDVEFTYGGIEVRASWRVNNIFAGNVVEEIGSLRNGDEPSAAVRRAIVRAASLAAREAP